MSRLRFAVRVKAGAGRTAVGGRWDGPGEPALVVAVAAPADAADRLRALLDKP